VQRYLATPEETDLLGVELWSLLPAQSLIFLQGDLGAGKTTLVRAYLRAAGFVGTVKSPTYTLVEEYLVSGRKIVHFDLYRITEPEELEWIGIRDYFNQECVCFIEWPDKGNGFLPLPDYVISLNTEGQGRLIEITKVNKQTLQKF